MALNIYIPDAPTPEELARLTSQLDAGIHVAVGETLPDDFHVLIAGRPTADLLNASPNLHTLLIPFAGLPDVTRQIMRDYLQITVYNLHHNNIATAEMALALIFACARQLIPAHNTFRHNDWSTRYAPLPQVILHGKTTLILGYGSIGQHVAPVLKALGMRVLGIRRSQSDPDNGIYTMGSLHDLLPQANVLLCTLPATDETTGLIGAREFELLPDSAIVVNVGRGIVIDQQAFYEALKSRKLHAGASDVWYHYPNAEEFRKTSDGVTDLAPSDVPFGELDNMIMSPHRAGAFGNPDVERFRYNRIAELMNQLAKGEPLPNRVDLDRGY